jgi:hypothetical protein
MRIPVQTSFGLALLPLPVTIEEDAHSRARGGASERAREAAFYQGFPERRSREPIPGERLHPTSLSWPRSAWKLFVGLVSHRG